MKQFFLIPIAVAALAVPAVVLARGGGGFDSVVHSIESRYHVHANRIPFLGLISFVSRTASHGAVGGLHVAEIESFTEPVNGEELNSMVEQKLGPGWERMIRETGKSGNQTLVYIHPEGERMGMLVVDKDGNEMDVVQVSVDPKHLDDDIDQYRHHHHGGATDNHAGDKGDEQPD
jgi:hypothetical protein